MVVRSGFRNRRHQDKWPVFHFGVVAIRLCSGGTRPLRAKRQPGSVERARHLPVCCYAVPVVAWDLLPTFAALAGYKGKLPSSVDGYSIGTLLKNAARAASTAALIRWSSTCRTSSEQVWDERIRRFGRATGS